MPTTKKQVTVTKPRVAWKRPQVSNLGEKFNALQNWLDANVLPILSWIALLGLAVIGLMSILQSLSHDSRLALSIAVVAFFATVFKR